VREATAAGLDRPSVERLRELAAMFRGPFLEGLELPDLHDFEAWRVAEREEFRQLHRRLLRELVSRLDATPEEALVPARELVRLAPGDESSRLALIRLLAAADRRAEAEEHYTLGRRQIEEAGGDLGELHRTWRKVPEPVTGPSAAERDAARQEVRFCTAPDGVRIAYTTVGQGTGPDQDRQLDEPPRVRLEGPALASPGPRVVGTRRYDVLDSVLQLRQQRSGRQCMQLRIAQEDREDQPGILRPETV